MKTILTIIVLAALGFGAYYWYQNQNKTNLSTDNNTTMTPTPTPTPPATDSETISDHPVATIETNQGTFKVTLDHTSAPKTVENFVKLSKDGFYNNLTFHRLSKFAGFRLIQGGDPNGNGSGGPGYTVPAEIKLKHTKGAIATARLPEEDEEGNPINPTRASSGSQFYIVLEDIAQLDGNYTVFGYVTSGMDVVEKIGALPTVAGTETPASKVVINKITIQN